MSHHNDKPKPPVLRRHLSTENTSKLPGATSLALSAENLEIYNSMHSHTVIEITDLKPMLPGDAWPKSNRDRINTEESVDSTTSLNDEHSPLPDDHPSRPLTHPSSVDGSTLRRRFLNLFHQHRSRLLLACGLALGSYAVSVLVSLLDAGDRSIGDKSDETSRHSPAHITHPAEALSSLAYALVSCRLSLRVPLFVLSVASFCLWANSSHAINLVDITSIFWVMVCVTIAMMPEARHKDRVLVSLNVLVVTFMLTVVSMGLSPGVVTYYHDNLIIITALIYGMCGVVGSAFYLSSRRYLAALGLISGGFVCKLMYIFQGQRWGTAVFHLASAAGIAMLVGLSDDKTMQHQAQAQSAHGGKQRETHYAGESLTTK